ncbi:MAG: ribonuclease PH [Spirochaetes bacterium]|nr:ribonuclease PH [Spirochaetota bacterium]
MRLSKRNYDELRKIEIVPDYIKNSFGSCLVSYGDTKVIVTAMFENNVPDFAKNKNMGWLTCSYAMIPGSTLIRKAREYNKIDSRSIEIQRFIGRALRGVVDLTKFPGYTLFIDADVINADGGTRCASITGGFIASFIALKKALKNNLVNEFPIKAYVAAVSVGIVNNEILVDLDFNEDSSAMCDINVVANDKKEIIDIEASGEGYSFSRDKFDKMLDLALNSLDDIFSIQRMVLQNY